METCAFTDVFAFYNESLVFFFFFLNNYFPYILMHVFELEVIIFQVKGDDSVINDLL